MPSVDVLARGDEVLVRAALPADVDESKAKAPMKDGLLELTLHKLEKAKRRTISIS